MMKLLYIVFLMLLSCFFLKGEIINEKDTIIVKLDKRLIIIYDEIIENMPIDIKAELKKCKSEDKIHMANIATQEWLHDFCHIDDDITIKLLDTLVNLIEKEDEDKIRIHGDDVFDLLKKTLWCRLNNKPLNIKKKLKLIELYWLEAETPDIVVAPISGSKIDWIWKLGVNTRPHGAIHVGIVVDTKELICFERTIGIYYPEGKLLERLKLETKERK